MKILYITNAVNGPNGLERVLSIKTAFFIRNYHYEVSILVLNDGHVQPFYEFDEHIHFFSILVQEGILTYFKNYVNGVQKVVDFFQPDIISICDDGIKAFLLPRFLKTSAKLVYERHASIYFNTKRNRIGRMARWLMRKLAIKFDRFIVLTSGNASEWNLKNVEIIPNPVSFFSSFENPLNQKKVIAVGSHSYNKGYDRLLTIWKNVNVDFPDWNLYIYGKVDDAQTYIKQVRQMQIANIFFENPVKQIQDVYEHSSLLVLPSRTEGFGMVLIEAMACGVPCVSFNCPSGPADIIRDGEDGFLVEDNNLSLFEFKLKELMHNDSKRMEMGLAARENVRRFSMHSIAEKWNDLFLTLIKMNDK